MKDRFDVRWIGVFLLVACGLLAACHTVSGVGEDVQGAGRAIERAGGK